jgi:hypothetical protein
MRDSGVIHQNVNAATLENLSEDILYALELRDIALIRCSFSAISNDFLCRLRAFCFVNIQDAYVRAIGSEFLRNRAPNSGATSGDDCDFIVQSKISRSVVSRFQSDTPLFYGMKSFCASNSALVRISPLPP